MDKFYDKIENCKSQCKLQEINIILKNLNTEVQREQDNEMISKYKLGSHNEHTEKRFSGAQ